MLTFRERIIAVGEIPIAVTRKRIKHTHLRVHRDGRVTISAPIRVALRDINAFAVSRLGWIRRQRGRLRELPRETSHRFVDGEVHYVWGRPYELKVVERDGRQGVSVHDGTMSLVVRPGSDRARIVLKWQKAILNTALPPLIRKWEERLQVRLTGYHLRRMKSRWGSCNYRTRRIRLNTELVTKPPHLLEYVLVHEMVHVIVPNHGRRFVALMDEHYPTWREARSELNHRERL